MKILLQVAVKRPFSKSVDILLEFCNLWSCDLVNINPSKVNQYISIPWKKYKSIWGANPKKGIIPVPSGTEDFVTSLEVIEING